MRTIFRCEDDERFFRHNGYVVFDLLDAPAIKEILSFYAAEFETTRAVYPFAKSLPYYISIFDQDNEHKQRVDSLVSRFVTTKIDALMFDYEVFYSNFMIKFPRDGEIEAHQDFNFVDESKHTAFNLWCPLVDTSIENGGLFVIPGSHLVFRTQRGPNLPKALTQYNQLLRRYAKFISLREGQAIIFDHKLVHYSPPNNTDHTRVAIQSVLKPRESPALQYYFADDTREVQAFQVDKEFILATNLWDTGPVTRPRDHVEELIPFPDENEIVDSLVRLKVQYLQTPLEPAPPRPIFKQPEIQASFAQNGYVKLPLLDAAEVQELKRLFVETIGEEVDNTDYGMYISLEETDVDFKTSIIKQVSATLLPRVQNHFLDCKSHLGSFLVKASGINSYTYPHQDWTFVDTPNYSVTVWVALVDTDRNNGALGFVRGSHRFFNRSLGSPSPYFATFTQGHEDLLYEYLEFVPLKAGEAVVFDNRTIHGAPPNLSGSNRIAVAIGMTPAEAPLYHYYLLPAENGQSSRRIAKFKVDEQFFHRYSLASLKQLFEAGKAPDDYAVEVVFEDSFEPFPRAEIQKLCEQFGLEKNGSKLEISQTPVSKGKFPRAATYVQLAKRLASRFRRSAAQTNL
jgi:ectoine hydroxylase-related dioxygenase (phytanoyl-CoA dioxygenase family)